MDRAFLANLVKDPSRLNQETLGQLEALLQQTPASKSVAALYLMNLKRLQSPALQSAIVRYLPLFAGKDEIQNFLSSGAQDRTMAILDAFLGDADLHDSVDSLYAVQPHYDLLALEAEEPEEETPQDDLISRFLDSGAELDLKLAPDEEEQPLSDDDDEGAEESFQDEMFTETLARILIRQHQYERALEIIQSLYLNFPNKSAYFADQIRYLEKLVKINKTK